MIKHLTIFFVVIYFGLGICFSKNISNSSWENEFIGSSIDVPFFPDGNANYWTYTFKNNAQIGYKIKGGKPDVRYFSFNLYNDKKRSSVSCLLDNQILSVDSTYEMYVVPKGYNRTPKENTLYYEKKGRYSSLFLRYYLPQADNYGGVSLPEITAFNLETQKTIPLPQQKRNRLNRPRLLKTLLYFVSKAIEKKYFSSYSEEIYSIKVSGQGYYEDRNNSYLIVPIMREENSLAILRFKPPSYSKSRLDSSRNVRYWSLSQVNNKTYNHYTMCDEEFKMADDGFVYVVISDEAPSCQDANYNYMEWKTPDKNKLLLIYRNLVSSPSFKHSLHNIPENENAKKYIGDYAPSGLIISKEDFNNNGFKEIQNK